MRRAFCSADTRRVLMSWKRRRSKPMPSSSGSGLPVRGILALGKRSSPHSSTTDATADVEATSDSTLVDCVDELSGRTVITVLDSETKAVVRQIPSPEWLEVVRRLEQAGSLLDERS